MKGKVMKSDKIKKGYIKRFSVYRIIEHWLIAAIFVLLLLTGLSQKFHAFALSQWFVIKLGGIDTIRLIHRISGVFLVFLISQHVIVAFIGVLSRRWPPLMIITKKDFTDAIDNLRYYFGLTDHSAYCDKYDYKQKFEYWSVLTGMMIMASTGLILWFPLTVTRFLPGEFVPVAKALHSNHALLIFIVISVWHIYNSIFSPDIFPLDTSIFTGYISKERMMQEHPLEYERLFGVSLRNSAGKNLSVDKSDEIRT